MTDSAPAADPEWLVEIGYTHARADFATVQLRAITRDLAILLGEKAIKAALAQEHSPMDSITIIERYAEPVPERKPIFHGVNLGLEDWE